MKKIFLFFVLLFSFVFVSAETKLPKLKDKEVMMVGKINVHVPEEALKFYAESWGVKDFSVPDRYVIYNYGYKNIILGRITVLNQSDWIRYKNDEYYVCSKDDYFLSKRKVENKTQLTAESPIKWHFYGSDDFYIYLPFSFETEISEGKKYIYVGDFDYYLDGSDFHIIKLVLSDSYSEAKKSLEERFGQTIDLYKADIKPLSKEE